MTHSHPSPETTPHHPPVAAPPREAEVLRCETTADFLAALPRLVGFTAPDSLFIVQFSGRRATSALRVDLPDPREIPQYLDALFADLREFGVLPCTSAPAIVISSKQSFAAAGGVPWLQFARRLERRLTREGTRLREFCCTAPDGWASYLEPHPPRGGHPLEEILASSVASASVPPTLAQLGAFAVPSPAASAAVAEAMLSAPPVLGPEWVSDTLAELFVTEPADATTTARLIQVLRTDAGWGAACDEFERCAREASRGRAPTVATVAHPKGPVEDEAPGRDADTALARLRAASEQLAHITPFFPERQRPRLIILTALAWWMLGLPSVAQRQLVAASRFDSHRRVVAFAREIIGSGRFPLSHS